MFSSQIASALKSDPYVSDCFLGVFPSDRLPSKTRFPAAVVANTDPASKKGKHWVCYYFDNDGNADYFDSYGLFPPNEHLQNFLVNSTCRTYKCNNVQLQGFDSKVCGQYCIAFLAKRARGQSMSDIVEFFEGSHPGQKDQSMAKLVNTAYEIEQLQSGNGCRDQCCCCALTCK